MQRDPGPLLEFRDVNTHYGDLHVLKNVSYTIGRGEIVALLGGNACGKSTTMKTIMGVVRPSSGTVLFENQPIERLRTAERVKRGIAPVLEARRLFPRMTVLENLELGAYTRKRGPELAEDLERVYELFPRVKERRGQIAGTLSGGEQQMLAIGRALMGRPRLLLLDEPSLGLAPQIFHEIFAVLDRVRASGVAMLVVEQNVRLALEHAQTAYVFQTGRVALHGPSRDVVKNELIKEAHLGGALAAA